MSFSHLNASDPWHQHAELSELDGPAAKRRLEELLRNGSIRIVPHGRDVYNRLLADVFVNDRNVAETLIMEGYEKQRS